MKVLAQYTPKKSCWFFHRWQIAVEGELTAYHYCKKCNARRILVTNYGYSPVDWGWVNA